MPDDSQRLRDKFLVMSIPVTPEMGTEPQVSNEMFKNTTKGYGDAIVYVQFEDADLKVPGSGAHGALVPKVPSNIASAGDWPLNAPTLGENATEIEKLQYEVSRLQK